MPVSRLRKNRYKGKGAKALMRRRIRQFKKLIATKQGVAAPISNGVVDFDTSTPFVPGPQLPVVTGPKLPPLAKDIVTC